MLTLPCSQFSMTERRKSYNEKEPGLIVTFDENDFDYKTQKFEVERFFRFFIEIVKEGFIKDLDYKNYRKQEIAYF